MRPLTAIALVGFSRERWQPAATAPPERRASRPTPTRRRPRSRSRRATASGSTSQLPDGGKLVTWVVYPEKKEKAGTVIVIHEIFGLTDWVRGVADQLAKEGFIAARSRSPLGKGPERRRDGVARRRGRRR